MSTNHEDPLYRVFEEHLHSGLYDDLPVEKFVMDVVNFYLVALRNQGHVPQRLFEPLKLDLTQDVTDMLKAKIYGNYGIGEYNKIRQKKTS